MFSSQSTRFLIPDEESVRLSSQSTRFLIPDEESVRLSSQSTRFLMMMTNLSDFLLSQHVCPVPSMAPVMFGRCHRWHRSRLGGAIDGTGYGWSVPSMAPVTFWRCHRWHRSRLAPVTFGRCHRWHRPNLWSNFISNFYFFLYSQ